ncbi:ArpR family protein [Secundilactobacillus pentosiphilus]|uniref:ArpR family protein n=1 Tax=Secundilactobacillus pentosiphilus TaxID=1714682 RepID=A0A1Z5IS23_9LACO|nr:MazG-like family protein [Secundilactobacillus pentosiphilus]GAX04575.1 ArpR family protein [Secundilactobacillus pentosiphilus]
MNDLIKGVQKWSTERKLSNGDSSKQLNKLMEELGELAEGYNKNNNDKIIDSMGDMTVVMIILCQQLGIDFEGCLQEAYDTIHHRKGKTVNGVFIKESDLNETN